MVPVLPADRYVNDFRRTRQFLAAKWRKPTLVLFSEQVIEIRVARFFMVQLTKAGTVYRMTAKFTE
jgi:hypothetical protein